MTFKVFVSYSTQDLNRVSHLQDHLAGSPIDVFVAQHSVTPSQNLSESIDRAIEQCDIFVLIWSQNAQASPWVQQEIGKATAWKKRILPLVMDAGAELPGFIRDLKYLAVHTDPLALQQARDIIVSAYQEKMKRISESAQTEKNNIALVALGAFLLWASNR